MNLNIKKEREVNEKTDDLFTLYEFYFDDLAVELRQDIEDIRIIYE